MSYDDFSWFEDLSPYEQQSLMSIIDPTMGMGDTNASFPGYDFGDISQMGGIAPQVGMEDYYLQNFGGGLPPEMDRYGNQLPWGMDQEAQATTLQKNRNSLMVDQVTAMLAGLGSYDAAAFDPITITPAQAGEAAISQPGRRKAQMYSGGSGYESFLTDMMLNEGMTPSEAQVAMWDLVSKPDSPEVSEEDRARRDSLIASLPAAAVDPLTPPSQRGPGRAQEADLTTPQGRQQLYDVDSIAKFSDMLFQDLAEDPTVAWQDPETGLEYGSTPKEMDSPTTEWYKKRGLPTPVEDYWGPSGQALLGGGIETEDELMASWDQLNKSDLSYQADIAKANEAEREANRLEQGDARAQRAARNARIPTTGQPGFVDVEVGHKDYDAAWDFGDEGVPDPFGIPLTEMAARQGAYQEAMPMVTPGRREAASVFDFAVDQTPARHASRQDVTDAQTRRRQTREQRQRRTRNLQRDVDRAESESSKREAGSVGRALAMQLQGRTPLRDALAQRLLGQRSQGLYGG